MPITDYSDNYLLYNALTTKNLVVVVEIEGLSYFLSSNTVYKRVSYGDPDIHYGDPGLVYGGLIARADIKPIVDISGGSLTISQRLEPEQGRGAISTISMSFIDLDSFMTQLISPGVLIPDILGAAVKVYLGYQQISFPFDYTVIFRGRVSNYAAESGRVTLQFSDANMKRRGQILYMGKTVLSAPITNVATTVPVISNTDFFEQILGPDGSYDPAVKTYIKIANEFIEYPATGYGANQFTSCTRGARGTVAAAAAAGDEVDAAIEITDHCIDMALKVMLSGWNGPYKSDIGIQDLAFSLDPDVSTLPEMIVLDNSKSADRDYGISVGDTLSVTGCTYPANDGDCTVVEIFDIYGLPGNGILTDKSFVPEFSSSATFDVRSQYDTYPVGCGAKLAGDDVDVARHIYIKDTFLGSDENKMQFFFQDQEDSAKTFIENQIYLPAALYSLTRFGRMSVQLTHPPLADQRLQILTGDNVLNPQVIKPTRGINNRKFFNEIDWSWDFGDDGNAQSILKAIDSDSINVIGVTVVLPIEAKGVRSAFGTTTIIDRRTNYLLSRYKMGAVMIDIETNWEIGSLIESGDVVAVKDDGVLKISNFSTGTRNLGVQLFEVINRDLDAKNGKLKLQLVSGLGAQVTDRFATISPSSVLQTGSTTTKIIIDDSYGALFPGQEWRKWSDYLGLRVKIHDTEYVQSATATLASLDPFDKNKINITGFTGIAASALPGMVLDIDDYSESTDPLDQQLLKVVHAFWDKQVAVSGGVSDLAFTVASGDVQYFQAGFAIVVHDESFSVSSPETTVASIDTGTNTITVTDSLGFTPSAGNLCDLLGFPDGGGAYRWI